VDHSQVALKTEKKTSNFIFEIFIRGVPRESEHGFTLYRMQRDFILCFKACILCFLSFMSFFVFFFFFLIQSSLDDIYNKC